MENKRCEHCVYNPKIVEMLKNNQPDTEIIASLSEVFKIFGDGTRIKILWSLFTEEKCVFDICKELNMTQSAISHQLKALKQARLVASRRDGKKTYYSLDDEHVKRIFEQALIHINENYI